MDFAGIHDRLGLIGAPGLLGVDLPRKADPKDKSKRARAGDPFVLVDPRALPEFVRVCRDDPRLAFEVLIDITATDPGKDLPELWIHVSLLSISQRHRLQIKALVPKTNPRLPTCSLVHHGARWHERECAEMFGIEFVGHPDPRHILLPEDWIGHPLRKDYEYPKQYPGISCE